MLLWSAARTRLPMIKIHLRREPRETNYHKNDNISISSGFTPTHGGFQPEACFRGKETSRFARWLINETQKKHDNRRKQQGLVVRVGLHRRPRNYFFIARVHLSFVGKNHWHYQAVLSHFLFVPPWINLNTFRMSPHRRTCYFISVADPTKNNHSDFVLLLIQDSNSIYIHLKSLAIRREVIRTGRNWIFLSHSPVFQLIYPRKYLFLQPDCVTNTETAGWSFSVTRQGVKMPKIIINFSIFSPSSLNFLSTEKSEDF